MLPIRSLLICTSPRSGSNWLCDLIGRTHRCGLPSEYFAPGLDNHYRRQLGRDHFPAVFDYILRAGSTANRHFAVKAFWNQLEHVATGFHRMGDHLEEDGLTILERQLPALQLIRLRRRDRLGQAISYVRARSTNSWWWREGEQRASGTECKFDFDQIRRTILLFDRWERLWDERLAQTGSPCLELSYEVMRADLSGTLGELAAFLGTENDWPQTTLRVQSDTTTREWRERFLFLDRERTNAEISRDLSDVGMTDQMTTPSKIRHSPSRSQRSGVISPMA